MDSERIEPPGAPVSGSPRGTDDRASRRADDEFGALIERQRGELVLYCYRLLGSWTEAEDAVQEASLRAWRARATFRGEASPRTWLHRIATRVCLDLLGRRRRTFAFAPRPGDPDVPPEAPLDAPWLEPLPERILGDRIPGLGEPELEPEARYSLRESVSLAFLAALQLLPPRQRAVLVLRDVLGWTGSETAAALETTVGAVESALHRARRTLRSARERSGVPVLPSR
ncbi:MAG TPA: sigma-70 family RNA polymerase sigma factor, partial [Candidatus Limnocylindrales bacterium]|nr:sigma-70 family RNA polymerase sigma factor [Candidatus Limnocylindrales bacterium]